jgi:malate dehydrogenase
VAFDRKEAIEQVPGAQVGAYEEILDAIGILQNADTISITSDLNDLEGCETFIFTAGLPRRADQSRSDLIGVNVAIVGGITEKLGQVAPDALMIMVTNPLDAMVELAYRNLGYADHKIVGQAGVLDTGRFTIAAALASGKPASQVDTIVMGGHGPTMVPVYSAARAAYKPLSECLSEGVIQEITQAVRARGKTIIQRQGRSAVFSTALAAVKMAKAYLLDTKVILPACTRLHGEYGYDGIFAGVPTLFSRNGVQAVEIPLSAQEKGALDESISAVRQVVAELDAVS